MSETTPEPDFQEPAQSVRPTPVDEVAPADVPGQYDDAQGQDMDEQGSQDGEDDGDEPQPV